MFRIAICDDEIVICNEIERMISQYDETIKKKTHIGTYISGEKLYEDLEKGVFYDLIFLDIELYQINGIDIGLFLRKNLDNQTTQIVYISAIEQYAMKLFLIRPLNFLLKPLNHEDIIDCITLAKKLCNNLPQYFSYQNRTTTKKVPLADILYFESKGRKVIMKTVHQQEEFYGKINDIYTQLKDNGFLLIHKSYLVNYLRIKLNDATHLIMEDGRDLPISRSRQSEISKNLLQIKTKEVLK